METLDQYLPSLSSFLLNNIPSLNNTNTSNTNKPPINSSSIITLLEESLTISSNPFISLLIHFYLKHSTNVILLSSREPLSHYSTILRKFGINLLSSPQFCYVDLSTAYSSVLNTELPLSENTPPTYNQSTSKHFISCSKMFNKTTFTINYSLLITQLESVLLKMPKENKTVLIIDQVHNNINDMNLLLDFSFKTNTSIIFTINKELNDNTTFDYISYISDIIFSFRHNESGFSKDVDGLLGVQLLFPGVDSTGYSKQNLLIRYSLKDNGIKFFSHLTI